MCWLTPLEVLASIQHAELCMGRQFTREEFLNGDVGSQMLPKDFDTETTVSSTHLNSCSIVFVYFSFCLHIFVVKSEQLMLLPKKKKQTHALSQNSANSNLYRGFSVLRTSKLSSFLTRISTFISQSRQVTRVKYSINSFQKTKLWEARQSNFNEQLECLAEPLGALIESSSATYQGI